jgi:hypothetical protein
LEIEESQPLHAAATSILFTEDIVVLAKGELIYLVTANSIDDDDDDDNGDDDDGVND